MPTESTRNQREHRFVLRKLAAVIIFAACILGGLLWAASGKGQGQIRHFDILASQYAYAPHRLVVNQGDEVHLRLASVDVAHGFFMEGQDLDAVVFPGRLLFNVRDPSGKTSYIPREEVSFTADRFGKFRYRCSLTCGPLHPFMQGELIVRPNYPLWGGLGGAAGILLAGLFLMFTQPAPVRGAETRPWRLDLLRRLPALKWLVRRRWFQFALILPVLATFLLFIIAGFWGTPVGNRNIIITFVWILWWFLLITILIPFGGRIWCCACPFPFFGEWFQRRRLIEVRPDTPRMWKGFRRWPAKLSNIWLQNILFLTLCTFSAVLVTRPVVTAYVLVGLVLAATGLSMVYRHRSFCNFACPVSGFLSLYSMASVVEIRSRDPQVCGQCRSKACVFGSDKGWGCPWAENPSRMQRNNYCGMCMECIKTCPNDNMTLRARPFCADDRIERYDEAWKAFIMITLALVYSVTLLGSWGEVKNWANISEMGDWRGFSIYAGSIWLSSLVVLPGLWFLVAVIGKRLSGTGSIPARTLFLRYSYLLVPLGLCAWIAFSIPLLMVNVTHILSTVSDPLGWGWNLFGTANMPWTPIFPEYLIYLQLPVLLFGLAVCLNRGTALAESLYGDRLQGVRSLFPFALLSTGITAAFMVLFTG
ncbi:MAG: hypothetical protein SCH71_03660 [Desulfobulbaceae bacterium]|nr:hypothetical protein [Desulfobulbaceae bacterium]